MVTVDGDEIDVTSISSSQASLASFHRGAEQPTIWDSPATASAMSAVLAANSRCVCLQAGLSAGMGMAPVGYAFAILPGDIPASSRNVLGRSQFERPRVIVVVNPDCRQSGVGRELWQKLRPMLRQQGFRTVDAEAEESCVRFFEKMGFRGVPGSSRQHESRTLHLLRCDL